MRRLLKSKIVEYNTGQNKMNLSGSPHVYRNETGFNVTKTKEVMTWMNLKYF